MITMKEILKMVEETELSLDIDLSKVDPEQSLKDQGMDSLDQASFFFEIETYFKVEISDAEIKNGEWSSINKILEKLNNK